MHELFAILVTGAIGVSISFAFALLLKPVEKKFTYIQKENPADAWIEGFIIGSEGYPFDDDQC